MREVLEKCPLFAGLSDEERKRALSLLDARAVRAVRGTVLQRPGEPVLRFGVVLSGQVEVSMEDMDGGRVLMASVSPCGVFAESMCFLGVSSSPVTVASATDSELLLLSAAALHAEPEVGAADEPLRRVLSERFTALLAAKTLSLNDRIQAICRPRLREKLMTFFAQCRRDYGADIFSLPMDRAALAAYLGTDRSALSRELSAMRRDGLIDFYRGTFRIL